MRVCEVRYLLHKQLLRPSFQCTSKYLGFLFSDIDDYTDCLLWISNIIWPLTFCGFGFFISVVVGISVSNERFDGIWVVVHLKCVCVYLGFKNFHQKSTDYKKRAIQKLHNTLGYIHIMFLEYAWLDIKPGFLGKNRRLPNIIISCLHWHLASTYHFSIITYLLFLYRCVGISGHKNLEYYDFLLLQ